MLQDIKTLLTGIETVIFLGEMGDTFNNAPADNCIGIFLSGGADPQHSFDARQFRNPTFQVRIRNVSFAMAETKANQVSAALDGLTERTINGTRYISIMQQSDVLQLGKDSKGRSELSINFRVRKDD